MYGNRSKVGMEILALLLLTLSTGIGKAVAVEEAKGNVVSMSMDASGETKNLLSNSSEFETVEMRRVHIDEESPRRRNDDSKPEVLDASLKYEVEILQPGKIEKEDIEIEERFAGPSLNFDTDEFYEENIEVSSESMQHGHIILTVALFGFAMMCIGIYAGLVMWRLHLEKRYGMRQRLMTEDDFCANIDDNRPF